MDSEFCCGSRGSSYNQKVICLLAAVYFASLVNNTLTFELQEKARQFGFFDVA